MLSAHPTRLGSRIPDSKSQRKIREMGLPLVERLVQIPAPSPRSLIAEAIGSQNPFNPPIFRNPVCGSSKETSSGFVTKRL